MELVQVLYTSKMSKECSTEMINEILKVSRQNNSVNGLTGILLFRNGEFVQILEGEKLNVYYTLKKIRDDKRHTDMKILKDSPTQERLFSNWAMAFKNDEINNKEMDRRFSDFIEKDGIKNNLSLFSILHSFYFGK
jgi:hypothetical protein